MSPPTSNLPAGRHLQRGFFLIELLGVLALIALLAGLVMPGLTQVMRTHRVRLVAKDLATELLWAQAEAARRGSALVLRLKTGPGCAALPCGWEVFADGNQDGLQQKNETVIHTYGNPADLVISPANGDTVFIDQAGNLRNRNTGGAVGTSFLVEIAPVRPGDPASRRVCINAGNRVRIAAGAECQP